MTVASPADPADLGSTSGSGADSGKPLSGGLKSLDLEAMDNDFVMPAEVATPDEDNVCDGDGAKGIEWTR